MTSRERRDIAARLLDTASFSKVAVSHEGFAAGGADRIFDDIEFTLAAEGFEIHRKGQQAHNPQPRWVVVSGLHGRASIVESAITGVYADPRGWWVGYRHGGPIAVDEAEAERIRALRTEASA